MSDIIMPLISEKEIANKVKELAERINTDYRGKNLLVVCLLRGAFIFAADLLRLLNVDLSIDFIQAASYFNEKISSEKLQISLDLEISPQNRDVLIIEDIIDTGYTLSKIQEMILALHPKSLEVCALLDKPSRRKVDMVVNYRGFEIEDKFVVGYGLDYGQKYRNLPYIGIFSA